MLAAMECDECQNRVFEVWPLGGDYPYTNKLICAWCQAQWRVCIAMKKKESEYFNDRLPVQHTSEGTQYVSLSDILMNREILEELRAFLPKEDDASNV